MAKEVGRHYGVEANRANSEGRADPSVEKVTEVGLLGKEEKHGKKD
jgi:hypothetical protein